MDLEHQLSTTQDELVSIRSQCSLLQSSKDSANIASEVRPAVLDVFNVCVVEHFIKRTPFQS